MNKNMIVCLSKDPTTGELHIEYIRYMFSEDYRDTIQMANELAETTGLIVYVVDFNAIDSDLITEVMSNGYHI